MNTPGVGSLQVVPLVLAAGVFQPIPANGASLRSGPEIGKFEREAQAVALADARRGHVELAVREARRVEVDAYTLQRLPLRLVDRLQNVTRSKRGRWIRPCVRG